MLLTALERHTLAVQLDVRRKRMLDPICDDAAHGRDNRRPADQGGRGTALAGATAARAGRYANRLHRHRRTANLRPDADWHNTAAVHSAGCQSALFIAERTDEWVGVAGGFAHDDGTTTIFAVFIDPAARGEQILEALLDAVASWSLACGRETLMLEVAVQNPRALAAYHRLGFVKTGQSRAHPLYPEVTEVAMTRPATSSPS